MALDLAFTSAPSALDVLGFSLYDHSCTLAIITTPFNVQSPLELTVINRVTSLFPSAVLLMKFDTPLQHSIKERSHFFGEVMVIHPVLLLTASSLGFQPSP